MAPNEPRDKERTNATSTKKTNHHHHHHSRHEETQKTKHHHHHHNHKHEKKPDKKTVHATTTTSTTEPRRHRRHEHGRHEHDSGRHPSSSVGPGTIEPVLLLMLVVLIISALIMLALGIWLLASRYGWPAGLNNTGTVFWTRFISYGTACLITSVFFIAIIAIAIGAALSQNGARARKLRLAVICLVSIVSLILVLMTVTALLFATNGPGFITRVTEESWENTVTGDEGSRYSACSVQKRFGCEGWNDNSCTGCRPSIQGDYATPYGSCASVQRKICPRCWPSNANGTARLVDAVQLAQGLSQERVKVATLVKQQNDAEQKVVLGCRRFIQWRNREFFIPMCVYTIFLLLVMVLLSWKTCIDSNGR